jgi:hypothetical protein
MQEEIIMPKDMEALRDALFEIFSAGFEAGCNKEMDLQAAFEDWYQLAMLTHLPPTSPYIS